MQNKTNFNKTSKDKQSKTKTRNPFCVGPFFLSLQLAIRCGGITSRHSLKTTIFFSLPSSYELQMATWLGVGFPLLLAGVLYGLNICRSYTSCYGFSEFLCAASLLCLENYFLEVVHLSPSQGYST